MTDTTQAVEPVIKTDVLGRMKTPAGRRETLLDEFERSGLSGKKFAAFGLISRRLVRARWRRAGQP